VINRDIDYEDLFKKLFFEQPSIQDQIKMILGFIAFPFIHPDSMPPQAREDVGEGQNISKPEFKTEATRMTEEDFKEICQSCPTIPALLQLLCENDKFLLSKDDQREIRKKVSYLFSVFRVYLPLLYLLTIRTTIAFYVG
jgi:hypothetical protein